MKERLLVDLPRTHLLRDYPNSMYFSAFDATIQAGGYNSFHETRKFSLPALFYPNMKTGMMINSLDVNLREKKDGAKLPLREMTLLSPKEYLIYQ